jgi:hypothetical protein
VTLFFNYDQAADLLSTDVEGVKDLIRRGELSLTSDGIPSAEVALLLLDQ